MALGTGIWAMHFTGMLAFHLPPRRIRAGHNRIASVMRANGLRGVSQRRGWRVTTRRDKERRPAPDLVQREFTATGINQLRVADRT